MKLKSTFSIYILRYTPEEKVSCMKTQLCPSFLAWPPHKCAPHFAGREMRVKKEAACCCVISPHFSHVAHVFLRHNCPYSDEEY